MQDNIDQGYKCEVNDCDNCVCMRYIACVDNCNTPCKKCLIHNKQAVKHGFKAYNPGISQNEK